jgi:hypothetical protein
MNFKNNWNGFPSIYPKTVTSTVEFLSHTWFSLWTVRIMCSHLPRLEHMRIRLKNITLLVFIIALRVQIHQVSRKSHFCYSIFRNNKCCFHVVNNVCSSCQMFNLYKSEEYCFSYFIVNRLRLMYVLMFYSYIEEKRRIY